MDRKKIKNFGLVTFCLFVVIYICLLAWLDINNFEDTITSQTQRYLSAIARSQADRIEELINETDNTLKVLSENPHIQKVLSSGLIPDEFPMTAGYATCRNLFDFLKDDVAELSVFDSNGILQGRVCLDDVGSDSIFYENTAVEQALKNRQTSVSYICLKPQNRYVSIAVPVQKADKLLGALGVIIPLEKIESRLFYSGPMNSYTWILGEDGILISHPNPDFAGKSIFPVLTQCPPESRKTAEAAVDKMIKGLPGSSLYKITDWQNGSESTAKKIISFVPAIINNRKWAVAVCMKYDYVTGPVKTHSRNVFIFLGSFISTAALAGALYYNVQKKKSQIEAYLAVDRVNRELQFISAERDSTSEKLREQVGMFDSILSTIPLSLFWKDRNLVYRGCNRSFADFVGLSEPDNIIGKTDYDLVWEKKGADLSVKNESEVIKTGIGLYNIEEHRYNARGKLVNLLINITPLLDSEGRITGLVGMYIEQAKNSTLPDVTTEKTNTSQAESQTQATLNHRTRNAAGAIIGFSELLSQEKLTDQQAQYLEQVSKIAHELLDSIDGIQKPQECPANSEKQHNLHLEPTSTDKIPPENNHENRPAVESKRTETQLNDEVTVHILVADDLAENRELIGIILKKAGYQITTCGNGQEAFELALQQPFDVILMDVQMPVMDGLTATRKIRSQGLNTKTIIIALTASVENNDKLSCIEAGCDEYLSKPVPKEKLLRKIGRFAEQKKQLATVKKGGDIISYLAEDPDYQKTIVMFVSNLPSRIQELRDALEQGNLKDLAFKAHAIKGLGGFAGFSVYTEIAKNIETMAKEGQLEQIQDQLDEMVRLCTRTKIKSS